MASKAPGGKNRKIGRNRKWCEAYKLRNQREINKLRNLLRAFKREPHNTSIFNAIRKMFDQSALTFRKVAGSHDAMTQIEATFRTERKAIEARKRGKAA
jgi:hypothetical protein